MSDLWNLHVIRSFYKDVSITRNQFFLFEIRSMISPWQQNVLTDLYKEVLITVSPALSTTKINWVLTEVYLQQNKHYWIYQRQYSAKVMQEYTFIVIEHEENFPLSRWLFPIISSFCTNCLARKIGETPDAMFNIESFVSLSNTYVLRNQRIYKHSTYYNV